MTQSLLKLVSNKNSGFNILLKFVFLVLLILIVLANVMADNPSQLIGISKKDPQKSDFWDLSKTSFTEAEKIELEANGTADFLRGIYAMVMNAKVMEDEVVDKKDLAIAFQNELSPQIVKLSLKVTRYVGDDEIGERGYVLAALRRTIGNFMDEMLLIANEEKIENLLNSTPKTIVLATADEVSFKDIYIDYSASTEYIEKVMNSFLRTGDVSELEGTKLKKHLKELIKLRKMKDETRRMKDETRKMKDETRKMKDETKRMQEIIDIMNDAMGGSRRNKKK